MCARVKDRIFIECFEVSANKRKQQLIKVVDFYEHHYSIFNKQFMTFR